jgi:predicted nuclease with TOPRIM domain
MEDNKEKKSSGNKLFAILSVLFAGLSGFLGYQLMNQKEQTQIVTIEKEKVTNDFDAAKNQLIEVQKAYEGLTTDNKQLQSELDAKKEEIEDLSAKLTQYKGNSAMISKLKAEIANLQSSLQNYVKQIDSLNIVNKALKDENTMVKSDLASEKTKSESLTQEKSELTAKVNMGSKLRAYEVFSDAVKVKGDKEITTTKSRRLDKLRTCFIIGDNSIAKKGELNLFVKITGPDGQILTTSTDDSNKFNNGKEFYSIKKQVFYNNETMDVCMYFTPKDRLKDGNYKSELFIEGDKVGENTFELK